MTTPGPGPTAPAGGGRGALAEVARLFLLLGVVGFGGPAAHIAMMRDQVVRRRAWVDDDEFVDLVGATALIPGPNSTELAIHLGHRRAGWRGLLVAGVTFIAPAAGLVALLAWLYERHGTSPAVVDLRYGVLPVVIAIVAHALWGMGGTALRGPLHVALAAGALAAFLGGVHELAVLAVAAAVAGAWAARAAIGRAGGAAAFLPLAAAPARPSATRLFLVFLEIGSVLYGSGYVLLAFLQRSLVDDLGWLTETQLLDAVTVGQVTPGPVFTTATFVGWQVDGPWGALVATVGIFLPSFVFVAVLGPLVRWVRARPVARAVLAGVTSASLGLMAGVLVRLVDDAVVDVLTGAVAVAALIVLVRTRLNSAWLVGAGALVGLVRLAAG